MNNNKKTILVTGGAGYIGSHTVVELLKSNYSVIVIDNLSNCYAVPNDKPECLKRVEQITGQPVQFYHADIRNREQLESVFSRHKIDAVIHFAALKAVGESVKIPLEYYSNNVTGSANLFSIMQKHNVKNLVYSSSATVYGKPQFFPMSESHPTGVDITNPYGRTKYFTEEILKDLVESDPKWRVILLRYFNPVGAHESGLIGEDPLDVPNNLMPYLAQVAIGRREKLLVFGDDYRTDDGTGVRDYIHITDLAEGHVRALEKISQGDFNKWRAYNLGTGNGYSVLELVRAFSRACGKELQYEIVGRRDGDVDKMYAGVEKAKNELNWQAKRGIDEMCADTWRWQSRNPNGYQKS